MQNSRWYKEGWEAGYVPPDGKNPPSPYAERSPKDLIWKEGRNAAYTQWALDNAPPAPQP